MQELYLFNVDGTYYGFNSIEETVVFNGVSYKYANVIATNVTMTDSFAKGKTSFKFPKDNSFALMMLQDLTERVTGVTIYRDGSVYWRGEVESVNAGPFTITLECSSLYSFLQRSGAIPKIGLYCTHTLYSSYGCRLNKENFGTNYSVLNISGRTFSVGALSGNRYNGGEATINGQSRAIKSHVENSITLLYPFTGVQSGTLRLYPGCDLSISTCESVFNNRINHGGFANIPMINPFSSDGAV